MDSAGKFAVWIAIAVISFQLFVPPIIGLANNADFAPVQKALHLAAVDDKDLNQYFEYIVPTWKPQDLARDPKLFTSEILLLCPAYAVNRYLLSKDGLFDLRWTGLTHGLLFVLALWLVRPLFARIPPKRKMVLWGITLFFFLDVEYVSWFNSMYGDAASVVLLFLLVAFFLRLALQEGSARWNQIGFLVCMALFISSKTPRVVLGVPLLLFVLWNREMFGLCRRSWLNWALAGTSVVASGAMLSNTRTGYSDIALYDTIFAGILPHSQEPNTVLAELGFDSTWSRYIGTNAYSLNTGFHEGFVDKTSRARVGIFYLKHPSVALATWEREFGQGGIRRPSGFGNFARHIGYPGEFQARSFALASRLKAALMADNPFVALLYLLVSCGVLSYALQRSENRGILFGGSWLLIVLAITEMLVNTFGDVVETTRHLFIYNTLADIILIAAVAAAMTQFEAAPTKQSSAREETLRPTTV